jgi:hypothetical protein
MSANGGGRGADGGPKKTMLEIARSASRNSQHIQFWNAYLQTSCSEEDVQLGEEASELYETRSLLTGQTAEFVVGQILIVFVTTRVEMDPQTQLAKVELVPFHRVNSNFIEIDGAERLSFEAVANKCAAYPFVIEQVAPVTADGMVMLLGRLAEGIDAVGESTDTTARTFPLFNTDVRAHGGHRILVGDKVSIPWYTGDHPNAYRRITTPTADLANALELPFVPNETVGGRPACAAMLSSTGNELFKSKMDPDGMRLDCTGNRATYDADVKNSQGYRRSACELKRNAMLGLNGYLIDAKKMQKLTIEANTVDIDIKPHWAPVHNHQEALLKCPVYTNPVKLNQYLIGTMDPNNGNPSENFSICDCHPSDPPYDPNNRDCITKGIENYDKLRSTFGDDMFHRCSQDLIARIECGELMDYSPKLLAHALHLTMVGTTNIASNPFEKRFFLQPPGEVVKVWIEQVKHFFSKAYLNNLRANWDHVQEKRARVLQGIATGGVLSSTEDGKSAALKRKRETVSADQKLCTAQSFFELKGSKTKCTNTKCLNKHSRLHDMTKEDAIKCIEKYGSRNSHKKLLAAAETHFGSS